MNETNWRYQLSAMWNHGNWAIEANANNLFMMKEFVFSKMEILTPDELVERINRG